MVWFCVLFLFLFLSFGISLHICAFISFLRVGVVFDFGLCFLTRCLASLFAFSFVTYVTNRKQFHLIYFWFCHLCYQSQIVSFDLLLFFQVFYLLFLFVVIFVLFFDQVYGVQPYSSLFLFFIFIYLFFLLKTKYMAFDIFKSNFLLFLIF